MLWHCNGCTTAYPPEGPRCPHCGADDHHDQGDPPTLAEGDTRCPHCDYEENDMAKISKVAGLSDATQETGEGVEAPADGTMIEITGDGTGQDLAPIAPGDLDPVGGMPGVAYAGVAEGAAVGESGSEVVVVDPGSEVNVESGLLPEGALVEEVGAVVADELEPFPVRPKENASTAEWAQYVMELDSAVEIGGLSRAELIVLADETEADLRRR